MKLSNVIQEPVSAKDFRLSIPSGLTLPESVDLRLYAGDIEDQGRLGSCTANATVSALELMLDRAGKFSHLSRLFVYYNEREPYGWQTKDSGAYLSDGFKSVYKLGVPPETVWPYIESKVRAFTQSEYSHVGTAWVIGERVFVIEAVTPLVRIFPLSKLLPFYHLPMNAPWSPQALEYALSKIGEPYSQLQAIQAFFKLPNDDSLWECAELARLIAAKDGINLGESAVPSGVVDNALRSGATLSLITP